MDKKFSIPISLKNFCFIQNLKTFGGKIRKCSPKKYSFSFRITTERFEELRKQAKEIFPEIEVDFFYEKYQKGSKGEARGHRGCFYNTYKSCRKRLRSSGILNAEYEEEDNDKDNSVETLNRTKSIILLLKIKVAKENCRLYCKQNRNETILKNSNLLQIQNFLLQFFIGICN